MFWHNFKFAFKTLIKNRELIFWTLAFPFILALLFNLAFARLHDYDVFEAFDIAIVNDESYQNAIGIKSAYSALSEGDEKIFNIKYASREDADKMLENEEIEGYVYIADGQIHVAVKTNGTNQTVLATVSEQISQSVVMVEDIVATDIQRSGGQEINIPEIAAKAMKIVSEAEPNVKDESRVMNIVSIEFFTLVAMACMQGAMISSEMMDRSLPNITNRGKRVSIAPTRKSVIVGSNLLAGYLLLFVSVTLLILFTRFVLGIEYGSNIALMLLVAVVGSLTSTMMGMFLSVFLKAKSGAKQVIVLVVTMVGCLFAGMFGGMKNYFDEALPFVNKISPVGLITDGFYSLYYYDDISRYVVNIVSLLVIAAIFFALSVRSLRRNRYDSV